MFHHLLGKLVQGAILKDPLVCALLPLIVIQVETQHIDDAAEKIVPCKATFARGKARQGKCICASVALFSPSPLVSSAALYSLLASCVFQVTVTKAETKSGNEKVTKKVTFSQCNAKP